MTVWYLYKSMRDADIRRVLREQLDRSFKGDSKTMIIEELGLCRGTVRVDIAVVNGTLKGYEIKSAQDTLIRLSAQADAYNRIFDTMTLVVAERHLRAAKAMVPDWWGIQVVTVHEPSSSLMVEHTRGESNNPGVDPSSLVELLWRGEALKLLDQTVGLKSLRSKPRRVLWEVLARSVPLTELRRMVRDCLKSRSGWRSDPQQRQGDGMSRPSATLSDSLYQRVPPRSRQYTHRPS
jgi:hypothetical protein